ncbi:MAG: oxidoreductase [Mycobacterium sp.]|nr:oxidoreductase [Mycobacterium sp.]
MGPSISASESSVPALDAVGPAMSHIPALQALSGYRLRAVATGSAASAERAGTEFGVDGFDDPRALIEHPLVDLVVVAVKVTHHQQLVSQALAAGKMVFCERPLGVDAYEAQSITDEAVRAGVPTVVGLQSRFTAGVRQAAELVRSGHLGRVVSTSIVGSGLAWRRVTDPSHAYMYDGRSGATTLTVPAAHALDH